MMYKMRRRLVYQSLHYYRLKGSLTAHTIWAWYERKSPFMTLYMLNVIAVTRIRTPVPTVTYPTLTY